MKRQLVVIALLLAVLLLLMFMPYGAWAEDHRNQDLIRWTRYYEQRMGIAQALSVRFESTLGLDAMGDEICGLMVWGGIKYSESKNCRKAYANTRVLALHEVCHYRMQHHMVDLPSLQKEDEVKACMNWYMEVRRR